MDRTGQLQVKHTKYLNDVNTLFFPRMHCMGVLRFHSSVSALTFVGNIHPVCIQDTNTGVSLHHNSSSFHIFLIFWWLSCILIICVTLQSIFILYSLSRRWRGCCSFLFWFQQNCRLLAHLLLYFFLFFLQEITALKNCSVFVEFLFVTGFSFSW